MGHHYNTIVGTGKNQAEAKREAIDDFLNEEGNRHSVRECKAMSMVKVPPKKRIEKKVGRNTYITMEVDPTAPQAEWLECWTFDLHTHA